MGAKWAKPAKRAKRDDPRPAGDSMEDPAESSGEGTPLGQPSRRSAGNLLPPPRPNNYHKAPLLPQDPPTTNNDKTTKTSSGGDERRNAGPTAAAASSKRSGRKTISPLMPVLEAVACFGRAAADWKKIKSALEEGPALAEEQKRAVKLAEGMAAARGKIPKAEENNWALQYKEGGQVICFFDEKVANPTPLERSVLEELLCCNKVKGLRGGKIVP